MYDHGDSVLIERSPPEDGGGYLLTVPDLPGCMSDGATHELAACNGGGDLPQGEAS